MHQSTIKKFTMCPLNLFGFLFILTTLITIGHCKKQQFFKIKPNQTAQVIEGGQIILYCKIGNQQGRVQWSKDGFLLGHDRNVPGFPRYSIFGDERDGVHNLRIDNAKSEDSGDFECQVGPAENSPGLRAHSKLTVILKPTSIEISGHSNGSKVDIEQNEITTLDCIVYGGRPLARIKWFKNTQEIRIGLNESESHSESKPFYRSSLTIKPSAIENMHIYTCMAVHPALNSLSQQQLSILNSNLLSNIASNKNPSPLFSIKNQLFSQVKLNVLYPAEPPKITGYTNTDVLRAGTTLSLTCRSIGGNPQPQVIWYRNNVQIDSSYTIDAGKESVNPYTFTVDANDHNAVYKCIARTPSVNGFDYVQLPTKYLQLDQSSNIQTAEVRLNVQYAPSSVKILGETEVKQNSLVRMRCVTSKANPPAEISWVVDGHLVNATTTQIISANNFSLEKYISNYNRNPQPLESTTALSSSSSLIDDKAGYITIAEITYRVRPDERNQKTFSCYALSQTLQETVVENALLNILYPCEQPTILNYKMGVPLKAGINHRLSCVVHSGYPRPRLIWKRNGQQLTLNDQNVISLIDMKQPTQRNKTNSNDKTNIGPTSELTIKVRPEDDNAVYSCSAQNSAMEKPLITSVQLAVQYAPSNVTIRADPQIVEAGQLLQLSCLAAPSNPPAELSWWNDGLPVTIGIANATTETSNIRPINSSITNQVSLLRLRTTSAMNGKVFTCQATNHALQQSAHDAITLNIHFKPEFTSFAKVVNLIEGESTLINFTAISANPPEIKNRWYREDGKQIASNRFKPEDSFLNVTNIQRTDAAVYRVEAQNSVGTSATTLTINVQYPPEITKTSETILIDAGSNAQLECDIDANPYSSSIVSWKRLRTEDDQQELANLIELDNERQRILVENGELTRHHPDIDPTKFEAQFEQNKAILVIHNVSKADSGVYVCVVNNLIGNPANGTTQLIVKQAPLMKLLPTTIKSASEQGLIGKLVCRTQAAPNVEFTWLKNDDIISKRNSLTKADTLNSIDLFNSPLLSNQISSSSADLAYSDHHHNQFSSNSINQLSNNNNRLSKEKFIVLPIRRIGLITMESVLLIKDVSPADYGLYRCKAENELGKSIADVHFSKPVPPDTPVALRAVNSSSVAITLKWVPGFNGGLPQHYRLRFKKTDTSSSYKSVAGFNYIDINSSDLTEWTITGLKPGTEYLFSIQAFNDLGESEFTKDIVRERTLDELPVSEKEKVISEGVMSGQISENLPRLIIIIVSVLGSSLLFLNIILVVCFVRRRRKKRMEDDEASTSKAATIEMYGTNSNNGSNNGCATETSISGEDEEKRSQAYSSQTDYAMEIAPNEQIANSTGLSTYLLDEGGISQMADFYDNGFFSHSDVNPIGPDVTTHYYIDDPTYTEALRKNAINIVSNGGHIHSNSIEPNSPMNSVAGTEDQSDSLQNTHSLQNHNILNTISNNTLLTPVSNQHNDSTLLFNYASINGLTAINQIPPMPPLRSSTNHLNNFINSDKLLNSYQVGYATLAAPGSRLNNNLNHLNNNLNGGHLV